MTEVFVRLTHELPAIVCFCIAGLLAYKSIDGWGWLMLVGLLVTTSHGIKK